MRIYVKTGLFFLIKKVTVHGKKNIPKKGAIIFIGNHQNALIDAILIPTTTSRNIHFLARASAFKNNLANKILRSLNMIPVYRIRDGVHQMGKNFEVFEQCIEILQQKKAIQIFPEGEHHLQRKVLPFKKGFARIIEGALKKYPELAIQIIPVGINYDSHLNFPCSTSIYYGKPILANRFFDFNKKTLNYHDILKSTSDELKKLTLHVNNDLEYETTIKILENNNIDYLNPIKGNEMIKNIKLLSKVQKIKTNHINWFYPLHLLAKINSIFPLIIWKYLKQNIKEVIFSHTFRFAVITTLFPLFYSLQTVVVYYFFNFRYALIYFAMSIVLSLIATKTSIVR